MRGIGVSISPHSAAIPSEYPTGIPSRSAIVNAPQGAILAVGRIADRVVAHEGRPAVRPMLMLTLSVDHRVADGARAAAFLVDLAGAIEHPESVLADA